jgi:hypothetical protein
MTTMSDQWYETVGPDEPITQGDFIANCPLISWTSNPSAHMEGDENAFLQDSVAAIDADVVIMTQACDIEYERFPNVILCPYLPISMYKQLWEKHRREIGETPTPKAWKRLWDDLRKGYLWSHTLLDEDKSTSTEHIVVDFSEIYSAPRSFIEALLRRRRDSRLRLLPPYREHLSQAFARFFMRVGLPTPIQVDPP